MILIGKILKPQGVKGEVKVIPFTEFPERFNKGNKLKLKRGDENIELEVEYSRPHIDFFVIKFVGINSRDEAEELRGYEIYIEEGERKELEEGLYYIDELIGCRVVTQEGEEVGEVVGFEEIPGNAQLVVLYRGKEVLIPFVGEICVEVKIKDKLIIVNLPPGLLEL